MYTARNPPPPLPVSKDLKISPYYIILSLIYLSALPSSPGKACIFPYFKLPSATDYLKGSQHTEIYADQIAETIICSFLAILHWPSFSTTRASNHKEMKLCQSICCRTVEIKARHEEVHFQLICIPPWVKRQIEEHYILLQHGKFRHDKLLYRNNFNQLGGRSQLKVWLKRARIYKFWKLLIATNKTKWQFC